MTVAFALRVVGGLILVADGRTKHRAYADEDGPSEPLTDCAVKVTPAPYGLPFAVAVAGRASIGGTPTHNILTEVLASMSEDDLRKQGFGAVLKAAREGLDARATAHDDAAEAQGQTVNREQIFHVLLASATAEGELQVWRSDGSDFEANTRSDDPFTLCGLATIWPDDLISQATDDQGQTMDDLVTNCFYDFDAGFDAGDIYGSAAYPVAGLYPAAAIDRTDERLTDATGIDANVWEWAGVGGRWLFATITPGDPVKVTCRDIGPMLAGDVAPRKN